jgi:hypothetical protein
MSIFTLIDDLRSEISESELSEAPNTTVFNIIVHVTAGDLPDKETEGDLLSRPHSQSSRRMCTFLNIALRARTASFYWLGLLEMLAAYLLRKGDAYG